MPRERQRRQQILVNAEVLFTQLGYHKTTLLDITRRCGIGKTAIYHYFPGKVEIFLEVFRTVSQRLLTDMRQAVQAVDGEMERVATFLLVASKLVAESLAPILPEPERAQELFPEIKDLWTAFLDEEIRILADILARGKRRGVFQVDQPRVVALALVLGFHSLQHWFQSTGEQLPVQTDQGHEKYEGEEGEGLEVQDDMRLGEAEGARQDPRDIERELLKLVMHGICR